jgi:hypothetical protein
MSDQYAIGLILVVFPLNVLIYHLIDRWFMNRTEAIITGVIRGVSIPTYYRRMLLHISWFGGAVGLQIAFLTLATTGWLLFGRSTSAEEVKLLSYMCAFTTFGGVVGWIVLIPFWYFRLALVVRQAESG